MSARRITPAAVLLGAALLLAFLTLLMPRPAQQRGPALDSRSTAPDGARGLYTTLARLRFPVQRSATRLTTPFPPGATYVILLPAIPVTAEETSAILTAVRGGATILFTPGRGALTDSLGFVVDFASSLHTIDDVRVIGGPVPRIATQYTPYPLNETVAISDSLAAVRSTAFMWYPEQRDTSVRSSDSRSRSESGAGGVEAIVLGRTFGRGHAIAVAPATILTNQLFRTGPPAVAIVRALEWAGAGAHAPLVFDEYHHGVGVHTDPVGAIRDALLHTPLGRATLMALVAALVLLVSAAWRPIAPVHTATLQRRSPLEHVQALARAYLQTHADRLGAERLVRGLRRRHPLGLPRGVSDRVYLETVRSRYPAAAGDATVAIQALDTASSAQIVPVRDAVARIENAVRAA